MFSKVMSDSTANSPPIFPGNATLLLLFKISEKKKQKFSEISSGIDEADVLIRKMDLEARSLQPGVKATLLAKLREYKVDLNKLKKEFKRISSPNANQAAHDELLASGMADVNSVISLDS
ncbi:hypothetical protein V6N13_120434 [Hibiscus sabdariffa]|uniref:Vesicle transport v-SNARE N-terminal domain-containing protein n=1 Tax=Hibiscus sabdariffa TaxID=183260 RepID=A0ABR2E451_9ROSI